MLLLPFFFNSGKYPKAATQSLDWVGNVGCKREGRRFVGQYVMKQNDVNDGRHGSPQEPELFWDRVSYAGWTFDLHNPKGMRAPDQPPTVFHPVPYSGSLPSSLN